MSNVKILPDNINSRITSEDARAYKPRLVFRLEMTLINPPEKIQSERQSIASRIPSARDLDTIAIDPPREWTEEKSWD